MITYSIILTIILKSLQMLGLSFGVFIQVINMNMSDFHYKKDRLRWPKPRDQRSKPLKARYPAQGG